MVPQAAVQEHTLSAKLSSAIALCENEELRRLERVQTFGCLVVVDAEGRLVGRSDNAPPMLGGAVELGAPVAEILGEAGARAVAALFAGDLAAASRPRPLQADVSPSSDERFEILAHVREGAAIVEFIPREPEAAVLMAAEATAEGDVFRQCLARAERVRSLTGYDRVMVYRFHKDFTGEVIAELRNPELPPYLGLRYPATDIPSQARELYLENRARLIPNIYAPTAPLKMVAPVDLSMATLRAVSPYHLEYLDNMGVAATLTLSIVVEGKLWGLIACHHGSERMLSHGRQNAALDEAEALAESILQTERREAADAQKALAGQFVRWSDRLGGDRLAEPLLCGVESIVADLRADGGALVCGDACLGVGATPDVAWLKATVEAMSIRGEHRLVTDRFADLSSLADTPAVAGAMIAKMASAPMVTLMVFRRAQVREVHWGGDPSNAVVVNEADGKPSPRRSFALWRELVQDRARAWTYLERALFANCVERLSERLSGPGGAERLAHELAVVAETYSEMADSHRLLVDTLPEGLAVLLWAIRKDEGTRLLYANRTFTSLFGLELSDLVGREPSYILERTRLDRSVLDFSGSEERELDVWSTTLGVRRVRARREALVRYSGSDGEIEIESLLLSDMTGASRTHDALVSAVRQAQTAEKARGALLRNMSHELRTPLNAILGYSDMMAQELMGPLGDGSYRIAAEEIKSSAEHLLHLINDTLEVARLREGKTRIEAVSHDIGSIINSAVRLVRPLAAEKHLDVCVMLPDRSLSANVDEMAIRQIVINLVNNAIKFTAEDGRIDIRLEREEGGGATVSVSDTGIGIPANEIGRLFVPFHQVDTTLRRSTGGTGLGLSIVKELVQLHGGKMQVTSQEGAGSTFSFRLPAWRVEAVS